MKQKKKIEWISNTCAQRLESSWYSNVLYSRLYFV